ncbi:MAG: GGDEF domain-containing protein [Pseudomonadota bacterium]
MRGLFKGVMEHFDRHPAQVPIVIALAAIFSATVFSVIVVSADLHHNGWVIIGLAVSASVCLSMPAAYIQYRREARYEAQKATLKGLASTDVLTGTMNRRSFSNAVTAEQSRMERTGDKAALILFDLDWFKKINDTFGHEAGDRVLIAVSEVAWAELRNPLDYLARWGGEEFAIFLNGVSSSHAEIAAERLRRALEALRVVNGNDVVTVTASFGIADLTASCSIDDAVRRADRALYLAKRSGRNRTITYSLAQETIPSDGQAA